MTKSSVPGSDMTRPFPSFDPLSHAGPLPSPCVSICVMDDRSGLCNGCQRSIDEIIDWGTAAESRKRQIWLAILQRRAAD